MDLEAIYTQGCATGNHTTGLQAVFQAGLDAKVTEIVIPEPIMEPSDLPIDA
jgi:hypothetical protein